MNPARLAGAGFLLLAASIATVTWLLNPNVSLWALVPAVLAAGVGIGAVSAPLAGIATRNVPTDLVGAASGVFNTTRQVGGAIGSAATGLLLQASLGDNATTATQAALTFPIAMLIVGVGCCLMVRRPDHFIQPKG